MSNKIKFYTLLMMAVVSSCQLMAQTTLELAQGGTSPVVTGSNFGPTVTTHVATWMQDPLNATANNNTFLPYLNPANAPVTVSFAFSNQVYNGNLTYGTGATYPVTHGLMFGAGPLAATDPGPNGSCATQTLLACEKNPSVCNLNPDRCKPWFRACQPKPGRCEFQIRGCQPDVRLCQ